MASQSGDLNPNVSIGELSSCHAALTTAECDSASEPAGDDRASDSVGVGGTNLIPRLRPMVCGGNLFFGRSPSFRAVRLLILRQDGAASALWTRSKGKNCEMNLAPRADKGELQPLRYAQIRKNSIPT